MRYLTIGVGDAFSARSYSSCLAVESGGSWLLVDCPHPLRKMLAEAARSAGLTLDVNALDGVVLTHLHADHCSGLEGLAFFNHYALGRRLRLLAHPAVVANLWSGHLSAGMGQLLTSREGSPEARSFTDFFEHTPLDLGARVKFGPFEIECRQTVHHIATTALRIRAGGRMLGYSADTAFDPGLIEWLLQADVAIHETNHGLHTPYERLAALPESVRRKMRLIHYPDEFDRVGSNIEALEQGRLYEV